MLLKDNHIGAAGGVKEAIARAKEYAPFVRKIEVEVETLDMVKEAVEAGADIIMLDNMDHDTMAKAMEIIDSRQVSQWKYDRRESCKIIRAWRGLCF